MFNWNGFNFNPAGLGILVLIIWETFWKAMGLWKSAKKGDTLWFTAIFLINLFGIIPIIYLWRSKQLEEVVFNTLKFLHLKK
ncbi:hypothetical protein HYZ06_00835 [Candidatus Daviesbacteria bacterium]|nr:hypothetical protein [Candidatus Daviesbacteria bacterium]